MFNFITSNVDRITALWQAQLTSKDQRSWWTQRRAGEANRAVPNGALQTPSDHLLPFRKSMRNPDHESFYTSDEIRKWTDLGYTYLAKRVVRGRSGQNELVAFPLTLDDTNSVDCTTYINQFYGWLDVPESSYPDLIRQFYPINLSQIEALSGKESDSTPLVDVSAIPATIPSMIPLTLPSHHERITDRPTPDPEKVDYGSMTDMIHKGKLRQWDLHIIAEK